MSRVLSTDADVVAAAPPRFEFDSFTSSWCVCRSKLMFRSISLNKKKKHKYLSEKIHLRFNKIKNVYSNRLIICAIPVVLPVDVNGEQWRNLWIILMNDDLSSKNSCVCVCVRERNNLMLFSLI